ncbi:MAG: hypothetical protein KDA91_04045 [Planctomycetaceae bacterium]|nr:hypothetical protein [Planctomycetaceae bacterium]
MKHVSLFVSICLLAFSIAFTTAEDPVPPVTPGVVDLSLEPSPPLTDGDRRQLCPPSPQPKPWLMIPHGGMHSEGCERVALQDLEMDFSGTRRKAAEMRKAMLEREPVSTPQRLKRKSEVNANAIVTDLSELIQDRNAAIALGKAFFWDMQVGSDGQTACASCHFRAGADGRGASMGVARRMMTNDAAADEFGTEDSADLADELYVIVYRNRWQHMTNFDDLLAKLAVQGMERLLASPENLSTARKAIEVCKLTTSDAAVVSAWDRISKSQDAGTTPSRQQETIIELVISALEFAKMVERTSTGAVQIAAADEGLNSQSEEKKEQLRTRLIQGLNPDQLRAARNLSRAFSPFKEEVEAGLKSQSVRAPASEPTVGSTAKPEQGTFRKREERLANAPTVVNAAMNDRLFHDGRAANVFNGYDHLGDEAGRDGYGKWTYQGGRWRRVLIRIPDAALASQATGPLLSAAEMSWFGRQYHHVAKKLLGRYPLKNQEVSKSDSHLHAYVAKDGTGLSVTYEELIRKAFRRKWWAADVHGQKLRVQEGDSLTGKRPFLRQTEMNFSLFWGVALMLYQQELVSSDSEFDRLMDLRRKGESLYPEGITHAERVRIQEIMKGLGVFQGHACADCHRAPEFAGATLATVYGPILEFEGPLDAVNAETEQNEFANWLMAGQPGIDARIERMLFRADMAPRFYDSGFYNIGVTSDDPAAEDFDPGVAGDVRIDLSTNSQGALLSISQRFGQGLVTDLILRSPYLTHSLARRHNDRWSSVIGSFKTPTMRNVALTAPYFHTGDETTLDGVLDHYEQAGLEEPTNNNLHPALRVVAGEPAETDVPQSLRGALVAFLNALTDQRVKDSVAPFDHPSLKVPVDAAVEESSGRTPESFMKAADQF